MSQPTPAPPEPTPMQPLNPAAENFPGVPPKRGKGWLAGMITLLLLGLGKLKLLGGLLKLAGLSKYLMSAASMGLMIFTYALINPLPFAVGFVLLILVHELGHLLVLQRYGLKASLPVFIPFMGAMIAMKEMPRDAEMKAYVAFGGPVLGSAGALFCLLVGMAFASPLFLHLAYLGFFLNLFNLTPLTPMDGGRIMSAVSKWFLLAGLLLLLGMMGLGVTHPVLILILVLGAMETWRRFAEPPADPSYYNIPAPTRWCIASAYFALVTALAYLSIFTYEYLRHRMGAPA